MPSAIPPNPRAGSTAPDELDNFFNYDDAVEDFFKDLPLDRDAQDNTTTTAPPTKDIDEEITVKKQRKPVPKLDADRLLSQNGLSRLRKITKSRVKFRGKGYEFSDISQLLNTYQLWLDDLFPRAKFRDALDIVEKVGHSKRMQVMRKAWLDATKPHRRDASPDGSDDVVMSGALPEGGEGRQAEVGATDLDDGVFGTSEAQPPNGDVTQPALESDDAPDEDDLDALLAESGPIAPAASAGIPRKPGPFEEDSDEDELDALLTEQSTANHKAPSLTQTSTNMALQTNTPVEDDFADEEEIMASMDMW